MEQPKDYEVTEKIDAVEQLINKDINTLRIIVVISFILGFALGAVMF